MSLDVYLTVKGAEQTEPIEKIFVRENGQNREVSREEWAQRFVDAEPATVAVDDDETVFSANITHNLRDMAGAREVRRFRQRPEEVGFTKAAQLIEPLRAGLAKMKADPTHFKTFDSPNGWGLYENFVPWIERYLAACEEHPEAEVSVSR